MITESDGFCLVNPPPEQCPRCKRKGSPAIGYNKYHEGDTTDSKIQYYEMFYECAACTFRLENMSVQELATWNSYPNDKQVWPRAMHHMSKLGRIRGVADFKNKKKGVRIVSRA